MICKKCGSVNNDDDNFCWNCGSDLQAQRKQVEQPQPQYQTVNTPINNTTYTTTAAVASTPAPSNEQVLRSAKKLALLSYCFFAGFIASYLVRALVAIALSAIDSYESFIGSSLMSLVSLIGTALYIASLVLAIIGKVKIYSKRIKCGMVTGAFWMNMGFLIAVTVVGLIIFAGFIYLLVYLFSL